MKGGPCGIAVMLLTLATAALGSGCGAQGSTSSAAGPRQLSAAPVHQPASGTVVGIRGGAFVPAHLIVLVGHPIQWENFEPSAQGVRSDSGARFRSPLLHTGQVFSWTPKHRGKITYRDARAPHVRGSIMVIG